MKLFEKRPLSLILCIMLGGFSFFADRSRIISLTVASVSVFLFALTFILGDLPKGAKALVRVSCIAFSVSVMLAMLWNTLYFPSAHYETEIECVGTVITADHTESSHSALVLKTEQINGSRDKHTIYITGEKSELSGINAGDKIRIYLYLSPINVTEGFNRRAYYISKGYSALGSSPHSAEIISHGSYTLRHYFDEARQRVSLRFKIISNEQTGGFLAALLTGERDEIDPNTELNFIRTGISHILALSGAHLVILSYAVSCLLKPVPINKRFKTLILIAFVFGYMLLTGMSACITRAGAMMIITSVLYLLSRRSDSVTSLFISVAVIVALQPYAVFDISLWLSAIATLGIIFMSYVTASFKERKGIISKILGWLLISTLASVFAITACYIICLFSFNSFSTLGVIATIVFTPITELLIYGGLLGLLFGELVPLKLPLVLLCEWMKELADWMASPSFALISLDFIPVKILLVLLTVYFYAFMIFGDKSKVKLATVILCILFTLVNAVGILQSYIVRYDDGIIYSPSADTDVLIVKSDGEITVIASGCTKYSTYNAVNALTDERINSIDNLIIPSYTYYTTEQILVTIGNIRTETVYLPEPNTTVERDEALWISDRLSEYGCDLRIYKAEHILDIGEAKFVLLERMHKNEGAITRNIFTLLYGDKMITYCSRGATEYASATSLSLISESDTLIIGGSGVTQREFTLRLENVGQIILGYEYSVSEELLQYYKSLGIKIITQTKELIEIYD